MFKGDISADVQDLFADFDPLAAASAKREVLQGYAKGAPGYHVIQTSPDRDPGTRKSQTRIAVKKYGEQKCKEALLAGERPKKWGPRWVRCALSVGIPVPPPGRGYKRKGTAKLANALVSAGTPGGVS